MSEIYKIVFLGLDFAGKTSILKVLEGSYSGLDQIKPTLGTKRSQWDILGLKVMNWDLGGQKQYREEYLKNYEQVLQDTNLLIYVIDVQDNTRFDEAGAYFDEMLQALDKLNIKCPVLLCLHKVDPDLIEKPDITKNLDSVSNLFSEYSQKHDVEIKVFITSIFDRKSLVEMFSHGIGRLLPIGVISQVLDEFQQETKKVGVVGVILFDDNIFVVGNAFPDVATKNTCFKTINAFTTLLRDFKGVYDEDRQINFDLPTDAPGADAYKFSFKKIPELSNPYYLLIMGSPSVKAGKGFSIFKKKFVDKIKQALQDLIKTID
ncbi:MAG: hypothetical protein HWN65_11970 [Candidatus Helarchaeota archaeon]|nr:hypothetical protein [Candidatus Helarchaeota archaeon]